MAEHHEYSFEDFKKIKDRKRIPLYHERADKIYNWSATYEFKGRDGSMGLPFANCLPDSVYEEFVESGADDANWFIQNESKVVPRIRAEQKEPFQIMSHYGFLVTPESEEKNYKAINEQFELQITNKRDEKYVYLIQPQSVDSDYIFEVIDYNMPNDVKEDLKNDRAILCLSFIQEGDCYETFFTDVYNFCNELGMPHKNFVFCSNNANLEIEYDKFCEENNIKDTSTMISIFYYYNHVSTMYRLDHKCYKNNQEPPQTVRISKEGDNFEHDGFRINTLERFNPLRKTIRPYHYMCYNRQPKLHRTLMVAYLMKENLLDKGLVSLASVYAISADEHDNFIPSYRNIRTPIYTEEEKAKIMPYWDKVIKQGSFTVDLNEKEMEHVWLSSWIDVFPSVYNQCYFSVVSSTSFDTTWMHPDEKFWKDLGQFKPFIWVGPPHSLQHLRTLGFKSFSPWIDESYDEEEDCEKRFLMIVNEVKRLCDMSLEEIHEWYHEMEDILKHNWRRILNYNPTPFDKAYNKLYELL